MPTSAREAVKTSPKIFVKSVHSVGSMRRPQASFEAQPRIARLLAPKMGIDPTSTRENTYEFAEKLSLFASFCICMLQPLRYTVGAKYPLITVDDLISGYSGTLRQLPFQGRSFLFTLWYGTLP